MRRCSTPTAPAMFRDSATCTLMDHGFPRRVMVIAGGRMVWASAGRHLTTAPGITIRFWAGRFSAGIRGDGCRITTADGYSSRALAGCGACAERTEGQAWVNGRRWREGGWGVSTEK